MSLAPIAFTFDADYHCPSCALDRFGADLDNPDTEDSEGNSIGVVMNWDCWWSYGDGRPESLVCGDCLEVIDEVIGEATREYLTTAIAAYVECVLWSTSTTDENGDMGESLEAIGFTGDELTDNARLEVEDDVSGFIAANWADLWDLDPAQVGHDFALTRDGHGAGFWDRGLGDRGDRLTAACKPYGDTGFQVTREGALIVS